MLHENSDLLMKFRKEDEKNALLTEQNERQGLFCTVTSRLLHDDTKIHATSAKLYNILENWREMKTVFRRFYSIFQYVKTRSSFYVKITEMTMSGLVLS